MALAVCGADSGGDVERGGWWRRVAECVLGGEAGVLRRHTHQAGRALQTTTTGNNKQRTNKQQQRTQSTARHDSNNSGGKEVGRKGGKGGKVGKG